MNDIKSLKEIQTNLDNLDKQFKEIKASCCESPVSPELNNQIWNICYDMVDGLRQYVYRIADELYTHKTNGHLPPIVGAERMNRALEAVGLDGDYVAEPKEIYAKCKYNIISSKQNTQFEISLSKDSSK